MQVNLGDVGLTRALATDILYQLYHALSFCVVADVNVVFKNMYATTCCFVVRTNEVATPTVPSPDGAPKVGVHSFIMQYILYICSAFITCQESGACIPDNAVSPGLLWYIVSVENLHHMHDACMSSCLHA